MSDRVIVEGYGAGTVVAEIAPDHVKVALDAFDAWVVCPMELCSHE